MFRFVRFVILIAIGTYAYSHIVDVEATVSRKRVYWVGAGAPPANLEVQVGDMVVVKPAPMAGASQCRMVAWEGEGMDLVSMRVKYDEQMNNSQLNLYLGAECEGTTTFELHWIRDGETISHSLPYKITVKHP